MNWAALIRLSHLGIWLSGCLAGLILTGCATGPTALTTGQQADFQARAEAHFARVTYLKPSATNHVSPLAAQLAPLLLQEVRGTNGQSDLPAGSPKPQLFCAASRISLNGRAHEQMTYWWRYPKSAKRNHRALEGQGVRLTLSSAGRPVIWEVLGDTSGAKLIFVAQSLEAQAAREFGTPLDGRKFAVERSLADAPNTVVARVIEDGPMPMGPIIYQRVETRDVTTVICRCMDAQADELAGQAEYQLTEMPTGTGRRLKLGDPQWSFRLPSGF